MEAFSLKSGRHDLIGVLLVEVSRSNLLDRKFPFLAAYGLPEQMLRA
jgi:hypothetical protein